MHWWLGGKVEMLCGENIRILDGLAGAPKVPQRGCNPYGFLPLGEVLLFIERSMILKGGVGLPAEL